MMKKYNVGIIGYSWAATAHIAAINAGHFAQVTAIYSSRELNEAELSARWGTPIRAYTDLEAMLADALKTHEIVFADRSAATGKPVRLR
jgi:UDP-N-acetyl-2-amino-2-deoxyglucuronate dehydrogenase